MQVIFSYWWIKVNTNSMEFYAVPFYKEPLSKAAIHIFTPLPVRADKENANKISFHGGHDEETNT